MIVIGKLLKTAQDVDSIHTFWYFTEIQSTFKWLYLSQSCFLERIIQLLEGCWSVLQVLGEFSTNIPRAILEEILINSITKVFKKPTLKLQVQNVMEAKLRSTLFHEENFSCYTSFRKLLFSCGNQQSQWIGSTVIKDVKNVKLLPCDWSIV